MTLTLLDRVDTPSNFAISTVSDNSIMYIGNSDAPASDAPVAESEVEHPVETLAKPSNLAMPAYLSVGDFIMDSEGLHKIETKGNGKNIQTAVLDISAPFLVKAVARNAKGEDPHCVIVFWINQEEKEVMVSTTLLHKAPDLACKLEYCGLAVTPKYKNHLAEYLSEIREDVSHNIEITYSCGWQVGGVFMLPNGKCYGKNKELVRPSSELQGSLVEQSKGGTMKGQKEAMKLICNNPWFQFCLGVALAGALAKPTGSRSVGFHIWSKSSRGKSIAATLAASIWQNPFPLQNWRSTANALEGLAIRHNDGFMVLDEIQTVDTADALNEASYMLANGKQKARLNADSTLKKIGSWNVAYLSTGEYDYATALRKKSKNKIQQAQSG